MLTKKLSFRKILLAALCALLGAMLCNSRILAFPAPFAAVLPAVLPPAYGIASIIGTLIGGVFVGTVDVIPIAAASGAALLSRFKVKGSSKRADLTVSAFSSATYVMCSSALSAFSGGGAVDLLRSLLFSSALIAVSYVFSRASSEIRSAKGLSGAELLFCCAAVVCAFASLRLDPISLGGIACAYIVLFSATRFGAVRSVAVAIACAAGAGICSPALFADFAVFGIPAFICGYLFLGSPIKSACALMLTFAPFAVLFGGTDASIALLLDCAIASVIFVVFYRPAVRLSAELLRREIIPVKSNRTESLRAAVCDISERLSLFADKPVFTPAPLSDVIYSKVCFGCSKSSSCFEDNDAQKTLPELDRSRSAPDLTEICHALPHCSRTSDIRQVSLDAVRRRDYLGQKGAERRNTIHLCSELLAAVDGVVTDAERIAMKSVSADDLLTQRLRQLLKKSGVRVKSCSVWSGGTAEMTLPASARINEIKITAAVSEVTGEGYSRPERSEYGESVTLRFEPKSEYSVEIGAFQLPAEKDASGDIAEAFVSGNYSYAILSDGMGIGEPARAISRMLTELLKELVCAGFSVETAVRLSSVIIRSCSPEESFATLDLLRVNRRTGATELYKAGACGSYLLMDGSESMLKAGGYPVGILGSCDMKIHRFFVRDFAALVMMTDGAVNIDPMLCSKTFGAGLKLPPSEIAEMIVSGSSLENTQKRDDISVVVVKIERKLT